VYLLKRKEVTKTFQAFFNMIQNQFGKNIKYFRSDNGGEFVNRTLRDFFKTRGIIHETTCVGTPQQNGVAERKNRHILETARSLLFENHVPKIFWDTAVLAAVYVINRLPTQANNFQTPLKTLAKHFPIPSVLSLTPKIFGCVAYVHVLKTQRSKLDPCAVKCVFLGVGLNQKGYKCYDPSTRKWFVTMDVTFVENEAFFKHTNYSSQGENFRENENWYENNFQNFLSPNKPEEMIIHDTCEHISKPSSFIEQNHFAEPNHEETVVEPHQEELDLDRVDDQHPDQEAESTNPINPINPISRVYSRRNRGHQDELRSEQRED
jgi:hypothetical protein